MQSDRLKLYLCLLEPVCRQVHYRVLYVDIDIHHGDGVEEVIIVLISVCLRRRMIFFDEMFRPFTRPTVS